MRTSTTQIPVSTPLNKSHPLSQGLVGGWPLNEGGGQKAFDNYSNSLGTLANGAAYTQSVKGNCVSFDGTDDNVNSMGQLTTFTYILNTQVFTMSLWAQLNNNTARQTYIATVSTLVANKGFIFLYETFGTGTGVKALRYVAANNGTAQIIAVSPDNIITDTNWHHIVITGAGSGNTISFYVDGLQVTTTYTTSFSAFTGGNLTNKLQFATCPGGGALLPLNGKMNNIMIYNRTLSATEVRQLYTNPYQMFQGYKSLKK